MKLEHSLQAFLKEHVSLNSTRVTRIEDGIATVKTFLENDDVFGPLIQGIRPQGSYRQGTSIKPPAPDDDFDVDILLQVQPVQGWEPKDYLAKLHDRFARTARYKDIVDKRGKHRCVTLDYANDFHIDIVPSISLNGADVVMNRQTNRYEPTDVDGYAKWFEARNAKTGRDRLIDVVKLVKYLRDTHEVPMKSVLLTTMLGSEVRDSDLRSQYAELTAALQLLIGRIDNFLQVCSGAPHISNPALASEVFNRHWDEESVRIARERIHEIRQGIDDAIAESDLEASVEKWQEILGEDFSLVEDDQPDRVTEAAVPALGDTRHQQPETAIPGYRGFRLDGKTWSRIDAHLYASNGRTRFRGINTNAKLSSGVAIKYAASTNARGAFELYWQVVNTGSHARSVSGGLRGGFFRGKLLRGGESGDPKINWERTEYTGRHWIQCFVMQDGYLIARSEKFIVLVRNPEHH